MRVDEDGTFLNSTDVTNFLVDDLRICMKITDGDSSWLNGNNEQHNRIIHNMVIEGLLGINQHEKK